jgi:putative hydrolase of the HAD superfamily
MAHRHSAHYVDARREDVAGVTQPTRGEPFGTTGMGGTQGCVLTQVSGSVQRSTIRRAAIAVCDTRPMPLLLLDLDNTLVDRAAAFLKWAERFAVAHGGDVDWLVEADADGYEPRARLAERIRSQYFLDDSAFSSLQADLDSGMADDLVLDPAVPMALTRARNAGWVPVIVTNGRVVQQERKLSVSGLNRLVDTWVISEAVGAKKPDPAIFGAAARLTGRSLERAWMIGDSATADIGGANRISIDSVWLHRGRRWIEDQYQPTFVANDCVEAIDYVVHKGVSTAENQS